MVAITNQQAVMKIIAAVGEAIKDAGQIPSGELYAMLLNFGITFNQFETLIMTMKRAGLVAENNNLLTWTGGK
jgi:hypothetical protein